MKKGTTLVLIIALSLFVAKPAFAQSFPSPNVTPANQDFYYYLPDCTVSYKIQNLSGFYYIVFSPTNPVPIQVSFYEQLPNDTEHKKTGIIQVGGYGGHITSTSYPRDVTMIELSNEPKPTPTSSTSQTPSPTPTNSSPSPTPTVPELSWLVILPLLLAVPFVAVKLLRKRK